jgi:hypothetical protein
MNKMAPGRRDPLDFWEANARWYDLWLRHNDYHAPIKAVLGARVRPHWRVLDIGGGSGVLSLFLRSIGCRVVLLEPAGAMRALFLRSAAEVDLDGCEIEARRWEDMPLGRLPRYDLVLACNSLHISSLGFEAALEKVFAVAARHVCILAEEPHAAALDERDRPGYARIHAERRIVPSSRVYHRPEEALEEASFRSGRTLSAVEREEVLNGLLFEGGHYWLKETAAFRLEWWTRTDIPIEERMS